MASLGGDPRTLRASDVDLTSLLQRLQLKYSNAAEDGKQQAADNVKLLTACHVLNRVREEDLSDVAKTVLKRCRGLVAQLHAVIVHETCTVVIDGDRNGRGVAAITLFHLSSAGNKSVIKDVLKLKPSLVVALRQLLQSESANKYVSIAVLNLIVAWSGGYLGQQSPFLPLAAKAGFVPLMVGIAAATRKEEKEEEGKEQDVAWGNLIVCYALNWLADLADYTAHAEEIVQNNGIEVAGRILSTSVDVQVLQNAGKMLANMGRRSEHESKVVESIGGLGNVMALLTHTDTLVQKVGKILMCHFEVGKAAQRGGGSAAVDPESLTAEDKAQFAARREEFAAHAETMRTRERKFMQQAAEGKMHMDKTPDACWAPQCSKKENASANKPFAKCARCRAVQYCSVACQRAHWNAGHKQQCKKPSN